MCQCWTSLIECLLVLNYWSATISLGSVNYDNPSHRRLKRHDNQACPKCYGVKRVVHEHKIVFSCRAITFRLSAWHKADEDVAKHHCTNFVSNSELSNCRKGDHLPSANNSVNTQLLSKLVTEIVRRGHPCRLSPQQHYPTLRNLNLKVIQQLCQSSTKGGFRLLKRCLDAATRSTWK